VRAYEDPLKPKKNPRIGFGQSSMRTPRLAHIPATDPPNFNQTQCQIVKGDLKIGLQWRKSFLNSTIGSDVFHTHGTEVDIQCKQNVYASNTAEIVCGT